MAGGKALAITVDNFDGTTKQSDYQYHEASQSLWGKSGSSLGLPVFVFTARLYSTVPVRPMPRNTQCSANTTSQLCKHEAVRPPTTICIMR
jgi:hypothetical protein